MAKKPSIRVALDLETTGLHAEQDSILEVAAIKFQGDTVLDTLETLVAPGRSIPYRVQRLTGITPQQLIGVPHLESIAIALRERRLVVKAIDESGGGFESMFAL